MTSVCEIHQGQFLTALKAVRSHGKKSTRSPLRMVVNAEDKTLELLLASYYSSIAISVPVIHTAIADPGDEIVVDADLLYNVVSSVGDGLVKLRFAEGDVKKPLLTLEWSGGGVLENSAHIRGGSADWRHKRFDIGAGDDDNRVLFGGGEFSKAFSGVSSFVSTDEARVTLTGVSFSVEPGKLTIAATDGFALVEQIVEPAEVVVPDTGLAFIVPVDAIASVEKLAGRFDEVLMEIGSAGVRFTIGRTEVATPFIDGRFPDYSSLIPSGDGVVSLETDLSEMARSMAVTSKLSETKALALEIPWEAFDPTAESAIEAEVLAKSVGGDNQVTYHLPCVVTNRFAYAEGEMHPMFSLLDDTDDTARRVRLGINPKYLSPIGLSGDRVTLRAFGSFSPVLVEHGVPGRVCVVMPMQLKSLR